MTCVCGLPLLQPIVDEELSSSTIEFPHRQQGLAENPHSRPKGHGKAHGLLR